MDGAALLLVDTESNPAALAGVRALRAAGHRPWVASTWRRAYASRSQAAQGTFVVPHPDDGAERFRHHVVEAAARAGAAAGLPGDETALIAPAPALAHQGDVIIGAPPRAVVARATDKAELARLALAAGADTPATVLVTRSGLDAAMPGIGLPAIVKPIRSKT